MKKQLMNLRKHQWLLLLVLFTSMNLFARTVFSRESGGGEKSRLNLSGRTGLSSGLSIAGEEPRLSLKSSTVDGNKLKITLNISFVNDAVMKALDEIKNSNKPGTSVAYEFLVFEVNKAAGTLKIELGKDLVNQQELLNFLQKSLDLSLKPVK